MSFTRFYHNIIIFIVIVGIILLSTIVSYSLISFRSEHLINATASSHMLHFKPKTLLSARFNRNIGRTVHKLNIALIKPTFTSAAYRDSFYQFFLQYSHVLAGKNITTDLGLLSSKVNDQITQSSSESEIFFLYDHLKTLLPGSNIDILTDADVDASFSSFSSSIFTINRMINKYDILIIGHQEYVTQREYGSLKQFVANGGTLIVLDGNVFYAEVKYDRNTKMLTLVDGHGWAFNGKSAWRSVSERWRKETSQWLGSNYLCYACHLEFLNNPFGYKHHEEQYITNPKDMVITNYDATVMLKRYHPPAAKPVVATYQLNYQKGKVIVLGIFSNDIIFNVKFDKFLDRLILQYALAPKARHL